MEAEEGIPLIRSNDQLDLSGYECENRKMLHFYLAMKKNLTLKKRKPCTCACEILKPPIFMLILLIGYFAADLSYVGSENYADLELIDVNYEVQQTFCVDKLPSSHPNPLQFPPCTVDQCSFGVPIKNSDGGDSPSQLCWNLNITQLYVVRYVIVSLVFFSSCIKDQKRKE